MASDLQSLDTIFNSRILRIPDYQRGYAWQKQQLDDFWEDLTGLSETRNHYTGQLTLEKVPEEIWAPWSEDNWLIKGRGFKPYFVVDGQQRLTTAIIAIKCLLEGVAQGQLLAFTEKAEIRKKYLVQTAAIERGYIFGYEKDNPSYEFLKTKILDEPSNQYQGTDTTYTVNLWSAQAFFRSKITGATYEDIERWFQALTQRFVFNVYELEKDLDVFVVFETMNNRGKTLSKLELLKNRLIYLSTLVPEPVEEVDRQALRRNVNDAWKTAFEFLGKEKDDLLDDDEFLRSHWIMYFRYSRDQAQQFAKFLLERYFVVRRVLSKSLTIEQLQKYVSSVQTSVRLWHAIQFPLKSELLAEPASRGMERLARLGRGAFEPILMASLQIPTKGNELRDLLGEAERFIFVVGRVCQRRADTGDHEFYRLANELFSGDRTIESTTSYITSWADKYYSREKAISDMRDLFKRANGFYSWSGLRYMLFEYEEHLRIKAGMEAAKMTWAEFNAAKKDHVTIEHIYPQTPEPSEWPTFAAYTAEQQHALRHSLGNLLALSHPRNSKFSNQPFASKKITGDGEQGYAKGSYSEIDVASRADWGPEDIARRGIDMLAFLESRWNVDLGTLSHKLRFLNLEFLEGAFAALIAAETPPTWEEVITAIPWDESDDDEETEDHLNDVRP